MTLTKNQKIVLSAVSVIVLLGVYITFDRKSRNSNDGVVDNTETATTTDNTTGTTTVNNITYKIEKVSNTKNVPQPIPDLNREIIKSPKAVFVTEADVLKASKNLKEYQAILKNDPTNYVVWLDMAMTQKAGGDYEGAVISWQYAGKLVPTSFVVFGNIADTYAYYLKDNAMAEVYFREAITKGPTQEYLYSQFSNFYRDVIKDNAKAMAVLDEGLAQIPRNPNLLEMKENLNK